MTTKTSRETSKTSRKLRAATPRGNMPRIDKERDMQEAIIEESGETGDRDRDLVHGDGGTIELPTKPGDLSKDD